MTASVSFNRVLLGLGLVFGLGLMAGCATPQNKDPLEPFNRKVFGFNEALDQVLVKPVATGYTEITPSPVRTGVSNFINNIKDIWSAVNLLLQGRPGDAAQEVLRVGINSTLGFAGVIDVATSMRLDRHNEDLGQTLGWWGVPDGAYLVLPLLGPSNVRDALATPFDQYAMPSGWLSDARDINIMRAVQIVNVRSQALVATGLLDDVALDKYAFVRDAHMQRRRNLIYNGDPPEELSQWLPGPAAAEASQWALWQQPLPIDGPLDRVLAAGPLPQWPALTPASLQAVQADQAGEQRQWQDQPQASAEPHWVGVADTPDQARRPGALSEAHPQPPTADELAGLRAADDVR